MNISFDKKAAIKYLYDKGENIETLQVLTGLSQASINKIVNERNIPKTKKQLMWEFTRAN